MPKTTITKQAPPTHYKVLAGGITGVGGAAHYKDAVITAEQVGDAARIAKLLAKGAIEPFEADEAAESND